MKRFLFFVVTLLMFREVSGQYCGVFDSSACVIDTGAFTAPSLYPRPDSFPPFLNNFLTSASVQFLTFDSIFFGSEILYVDSLTWDTIENLPPGLCWSTNKLNNTFRPGEFGCIRFSGLPCGATGQYKLVTLVTVSVDGFPVETEGDPGGLGYFVRLENPGDTLVPVDTTQTDSMLFIPYGGSCLALSPPVINLGRDLTVCAGSIATLTPAVSGGQPPYTFLWQSSGNNIICPTCQNPSITVTQNSTFIAKVTDASGASAFDTVNYYVTGTAYNFQIISTLPTLFCGGGTVSLIAPANDSLNFLWLRNDSLIRGANTNRLTVTDSSGVYMLLYTETSGCTATSNIVNLLFYDTTTASITAEGSDTICLGGMVLLQANTAPGLSYHWLLNDSDINYTNSYYPAVAGGAYSVMITNADNCSDTSSAVLIVASPNLPPFLLYTQFSSDTICNNAGSIGLTGAQPSGGSYSGTGVLNGAFYPNMSIAGPNLIIYSYTDSTGCSNSIADTIVVLLCTDIAGVNAESGISIYPNPSPGLVTAESNLFVGANIRWSVYDISGQLLMTGNEHPGGGKIAIRADSLAEGMYLVRFMVNGRQVVRRFVRTN